MQTTDDEFSRAREAAEFLLFQTGLRPEIGLILGSGLGSFAEELSEAARVPYTVIPHFPHSTAIGHAGQMVLGYVKNAPVAAMQGRVHLYEGYSAQQVAFPIRVFKCMGVSALVITNAAGGINLEYKQGALILIRDHINLQGQNPLVGPNDDRFGERFPDMTHGYSKLLRDIAHQAAATLGRSLSEGIYAAMLGPSYETPAEIHYLRTIGADLVGMSTVPEVIAASHMGLKVLAISCVTNMAAGILDKPLSYIEVFETTERVRGEIVALLRAVIPGIAAHIRN
jgi:purine-nucleoside phosphorylase